jgi:hypothetical protein
MPKAVGTKCQLKGDVPAGTKLPVGDTLVVSPTDEPKTLSEQGISLKESAKWQAMADLPEETVKQVKSGTKTKKAAVIEVKKHAREKAHKAIVASAKPTKNKVDIYKTAGHSQSG